jgi:hypothetical protein
MASSSLHLKKMSLSATLSYLTKLAPGQNTRTCIAFVFQHDTAPPSAAKK